MLLSTPLRAGEFTNPILPGGYPDPSICHDDGYYYIVNSTFEYFPGLPIHRSSDLVNWELIGHGLHRREQVTGAVNLVDVQSDGGIHAPTIRCRNGKFFLITTNVYLSPEEGAETEFVNFVLTADDPAGPWSQPRVLDGAPGIDPDIFFDDDGKVWYVGTHSPENPNFPGEGEIWLQQIDTENWSLTGERHFLWRGACGGVWAEGPHIYKRDGRYYLLVAEGGTSFNHAVTVAASETITGPYVSNPRNPILTSRHLSYDHWVNSTGHADLFELPDGRWYMVALGIRGDEQRRSNMGRETHLVPATWEREPFEWLEDKKLWPVISPDSGRVQRRFPLPFEDRPQNRNLEFRDDFSSGTLNQQWNFRRVPLHDVYSLTARPGFLRLQTHPNTIKPRGRAALVGIRQTESDFSYRVRMQFQTSRNNTEAGINVFQKDDNYLAVTVTPREGVWALKVQLAEPGRSNRVLFEQPLTGYRGEIELLLQSGEGKYRIGYRLPEGEDRIVHEMDAVSLLSKGYTGAYLGLYATGNGQASSDYADFDWVSYQATERQD